MILSNFLPRIKVDKSNFHEIIPVSLDLQEVIQEKYYTQTGSEAQKVGKMQGHNKSLLPHVKPQKETKILSQLPSSTTSID